MSMSHYRPFYEDRESNSNSQSYNQSESNDLEIILSVKSRNNKPKDSEGRREFSFL